MNMIDRDQTNNNQDFSVLYPKLKPQPDFLVPSAFGDRIILHIVKNVLHIISPPLMLIIQGPKGEGKSAMTREICSKIGVNIVTIPGALLSGSFEKEPVFLLREAYLHASSLRSTTNQLTILLIDDLDTSVASVHDDRRYTVNTQLLNGALMSLCDDPTNVGTQKTARIPIVATGNDFTTLHEPLARHGRAIFFNWTPSHEIKIEIIKGIFQRVLSEDELRKIPVIVSHFSQKEIEPVSFYNDIKQSLFDGYILEYIHNSGSIDIPHLTTMLSSQQRNIKIDDLILIGENLSESKPRSFLKQ